MKYFAFGMLTILFVGFMIISMVGVIPAKDSPREAAFIVCKTLSLIGFLLGIMILDKDSK